MMLTREDFGRGQQCGLRAALDRGQHRRERHQGLSRPDIPLEQAEHRHHLRHVAADLADHPALGIGELVGKIELADELAGAGERRRSVTPLRLAKQEKRELVGENLVVGEAPPRRAPRPARDG